MAQDSEVMKICRTIEVVQFEKEVYHMNNLIMFVCFLFVFFPYEGLFVYISQGYYGSWPDVFTLFIYLFIVSHDFINTDGITSVGQFIN
jgi:hypothetical protein